MTVHCLCMTVYYSCTTVACFHRCGVCSKAFTSMRGLRRHMTSHITSDEEEQAKREAKRVKCTDPFCSMSFLDYQVMERHVARKHQVVLLKCTFCPKQLKSNNDKREHEAICGNNLDRLKKILYPFCGKKYFPGKYLNRHMKTHT